MKWKRKIRGKNYGSESSKKMKNKEREEKEDKKDRKKKEESISLGVRMFKERNEGLPGLFFLHTQTSGWKQDAESSRQGHHVGWKFAS